MRKVVKRKIDEHMNIIKIAVGAITVLIALLFFGGNGNAKVNEKIELSITEDPYEGKEEVEVKTIFCDISGCVVNPGVYELKEGDRLKDLIDLAGGLIEDADTEIINRARVIVDGEKIYIPNISERENDDIDRLINFELNNSSSNSAININTATSDELQSIPGIGPVTAEKILDYRNSNGKFSSTDELMNISGIGEKTYKKMKEYVTV